METDRIQALQEKLLVGKITTEEGVFLITQLLSSMYNEAHREREENKDHYRNQNQQLGNILKAIEDREKDITKIKEDIRYHSFVIRVFTVILTMATVWAVPTILTYIFRNVEASSLNPNPRQSVYQQYIRREALDVQEAIQGDVAMVSQECQN